MQGLNKNLLSIYIDNVHTTAQPLCLSTQTGNQDLPPEIAVIASNRGPLVVRSLFG